MFQCCTILLRVMASFSDVLRHIKLSLMHFLHVLRSLYFDHNRPCWIVWIKILLLSRHPQSPRKSQSLPHRQLRNNSSKNYDTIGKCKKFFMNSSAYRNWVHFLKPRQPWEKNLMGFCRRLHLPFVQPTILLHPWHLSPTSC